MDLLKVRKSFGLSQNDVSRIMGVSKGFVSAVENGRKTLTAEKEEKLVAYLNIKPKADVTVLIDYLKIRLKTFQYENVVKKLLQIPLDKFNVGRGEVKVILAVSNMAILKFIIRLKILNMKKILIWVF